MRAILKSADGKHAFEAVVSDPPPATLKKHKQLWTSRWWGQEDLPLYASDEDLLHFKREYVAVATKTTQGYAIYREVSLDEANITRQQAAHAAEQIALVEEYANANWKVSQSKHWPLTPLLPTLSDREAASKATLKEMLYVDTKQAKPHIPEPEEPTKRWMKKCS